MVRIDAPRRGTLADAARSRARVSGGGLGVQAGAVAVAVAAVWAVAAGMAGRAVGRAAHNIRTCTRSGFRARTCIGVVWCGCHLAVIWLYPRHATPRHATPRHATCTPCARAGGPAAPACSHARAHASHAAHATHAFTPRTHAFTHSPLVA